MYIMCLSKGLSAVQNAVDIGLLPAKKLGFVPTAGGVYENPYFVEDSRKQLRSLGLNLTELDIAGESREEIIQKLGSVEGIFVAGGNTFFLLYQLQQKELDKYITDKVKAGLPYFGESAGAVLLAKSIEPAKMIDHPENAPKLKKYDGLGLIDFFPLPHTNRDKYKATYEKFIKLNQDTFEIVSYRDDQAIFTGDGKNYELIKSQLIE